MANTKWKKLYTHKTTTPLPPLLLLTILCTLSYLLGSFLHSQPSTTIPCNPATTTTTTLDFTFHHSTPLTPHPTTPSFPSCPSSLYEYTPCEDRNRSIKFPRDRLIYRQRHCPSTNELLKCLVPAPFGYRNPFRWPVSRGLAWFANVPHQELVVEKAVQNWVRVEGDRFRFPGGGTMFPKGADAYINDIANMIPIGDGSIRTAVDTGCGVASFGAYLMSRNVTTMSFAPRDSHEAQVQFALERGVPAMIGVIASIRLPYPSRAFDMAHCSRCLIPWHLYDGQYLAEVDRILRPGGYWVLSGPPINWQKHWKGWERTREDLDGEQNAIEDVATKLCWKKLKQRGDIAIWQKPTNHRECQGQTLPFCSSGNADQAWYTELKTCLTPIPSNAGEKLKKWPERLGAVPLRIASGSITGVTAETFWKDSQLWKKRVAYYKSKIGELGRKGRYRNLLDMNAGLGGFAAALVDDPVWVMNVMPTVAVDTLGVVYDRGLIGTYQDWCEAMSTYPRTYDLLHADSVFSLYRDRCDMENILLEMDRILRPEGAVIFRDDVDVLVRVKSIADGMRWDSQFVDHEDGPLQREKILMAVKKYWTLPKSTPL